MKKLPWVLGALICSVALCVAAYKLAYPTYTHRYRLTVDVDTPHGLKTGSSVIESRLIMQPPILTDRGARVQLRGDAVFVDLGDGKNITALLALGKNGSDIDGPVTLALKAFKISFCRGDGCEWRTLGGASGTRDLPPELIPTLVTFSDVTDPKTARVVTPYEVETVFGPGYRFKRAWVEITDHPITRHIFEKLPWLNGFIGVTGGRFDETWANPGQNLYAGHFRRDL